MILGRVDRGYNAFHWFGRPQFLWRLKPPPSSAQDLDAYARAARLRGADGFVFSIDVQRDLHVLDTYLSVSDSASPTPASSCFVLLEFNHSEGEATLQPLLDRHDFPLGSAFASRYPEVLFNVWRVDPKREIGLALIVARPSEFAGLDKCPYTGVLIPEPLATHDQILRIHRSGKEVFVELSTATADVNDESRVRAKLTKRLHWLIHEEVDVIILDDLDLLAGAWSEQTNYG